MRIVGGKLKGRRLVSPGDNAVRPTTDRAREALFNILHHGYPECLDGTRVLDLFAGTGALGIEAISRGASYALFIEEAVSSRAIIRENIEALGLQGVAKIFRRDATRLGAAGTIQPFDLVFADPPYGKGYGEQALATAREGGWLTQDCLVVVEEGADTPFQPPEGFVLHERRDYSGTTLAFCGLA
ncbi:16S rRNA (guanine(966)-N(2))-methyltransferase RsmD [Nitratireductor basaltis]|uniref:Putative methyltransferase n=1 Tax=Nitratireductor basaltis TaxID=472175 RepID=A0A084UDA3_9HYPH|nr:16S rRNA (guanine(966)-N(2))-methyltransferase RsmD [Nitratireductor basaltis]KFB10939.1 putative methyltransferase [Nitratireductor basaltis]